ncbi:MAG: class I SAM-dependent methyltransferase [Candidatus Hodarchaeales archaeon]|jgi:ubiquinone/menaquinone biosynthesis C-methylase UbiE
MSNEENRLSWNRLSDFYQSSKTISLNDIHYGPYSPGEKHYKLLGDVKGLKCLELGCGGGQISIVLSKWGASQVVGLDISEEQLEFARSLAKKENVDVTFIRENMEDLSRFNDNTFDLIISSHAIGYVENIKNVIREVHRVLRKDGKLVFCILHPFHPVIWEALEERTFGKISSYFNSERDIWDWIDEQKQPIATFGQTYYRFEEWINTLINAGFTIKRVIEPQGYSLEQIKKMNLEEKGKKMPYYDKNETNEKFIHVGQIIPFALIISVTKE